MKLHLRAPTTARQPTLTERIISLWHYAKYRVKVTYVYVSFSKRPSALESIGLLLSFLGSWAVISALPDHIVRAGPALLVALMATLLGWAIYIFQKATITNLFALAARNPSSMERLRTMMTQGMRNDYANLLLWRLYEPLIAQANSTLGGRQLQAVINAQTDQAALAVVLPAECTDKLDSLIVLQPESPEARHLASKWATTAASRQQFMASLRRADGFENPLGDEAGDNLVLKSLSFGSDGSLKLTTGIATYGEIVRTSDSLINEFAVFSFIVGSPKAGSRGQPVWCENDILRALPWRRAVHMWAQDPVRLFLEPSSRAAGVGVAVTMLPEGERQAYVARRSARVGTYPDAVHVIPAGMCNTKEGLRHPEAVLRPDYLKWTMIGELLEECYDISNLASSSTDDWVADIRSELESLGLEEFEPEFSGITIDLFNLRPEVCAVVRTRQPQAETRRMRLCWEYSPHEQVRRFSLESPSPEALTNYVQAGLGALGLASLHLDRHGTSSRD